ncbi:hypothetical protein S40293_07377 [Stachybotrys chartarum IBT 40293]|nr:hypothetical protein S40293_07377 [Stachybotrys chartarum IBT 40293]
MNVVIAIILAAAGLAQALSCNSTEHACCSALTAAPLLRGKVLARGSAAYNARLETYYSANSALEAWCMVMPTSTEDVALIASIFSQHDCTFGMRGCSHSAWKGANGVRDGVTIDFSYLNATSYESGSPVAHVQPGSSWGDVYRALEPYGVITVGGRATPVGVGGFTTGGGYSFFTNKLGWAADNVANFEVVLANGSVVNANAGENADLFKAFKGGSGNFGFITRMDLNVVNTTTMWGGFRNFDRSKRDDVFRAYLNFANNMDEDAASQALVSTIYTAAGFQMVTVLSNIDAIPEAPQFAELYAIEAVADTTSIGSIVDLVVQFTGPTPLGLYANWFTGTVSHDLAAMDLVDTLNIEYIARMRAAAPDSNFEVILQMQPVTPSMVQHSASNGGNVMGLEEVVADGPVIMWLVALTVDTAENQEIIEPIMREYRDSINAGANAIGMNKNWSFLNYANGDEDPIGKYGAENIALMKEVSTRYDPSGVFQALRRTGFKLPA